MVETGSLSQPLLYVTSGPAKGRKILLGREPVTLGRRPGMVVTIDDPKLSGHHADIVCSDGAYVLRDCMSTNGTYVNGELTAEACLVDNDRIHMGRSEFVFTSLQRLDELEAALAASAPAGVVPDTSTSTMGTPKVQMSLATQSVQVAKVCGTDGPATAHTKLVSLYEIARRINVLSGLDALLDLIVTTILEAIRADRAVLLLPQKGSGTLRPAVTRCRDAATPDEAVQVSETIVHQAVETRQSILTEDAGSDERFCGGESIELVGIRSAMCVPLLVNDAVVGVAYVDRLSRTKVFGAEDLEFLTVLCNSAAVSIANAQLFSEVQATNAAITEAHSQLEASYVELKETQQKLIQAEKLSSLGRLVAGIAHDLKNILASVSGYAQLLKTPASDEQRNTYIERLNETTAMCTRMVRDLLSFARKEQIAPELTSIAALVSAATDIIAAPAREAGVEIVREEAAGLPPVLVDPTQMARVLTNLMTNAVQAMEQAPAPRRLTIRTAAEPDAMRIEIEDTGCGIPEHTIGKIFDPFFTTKSKGKGTGLGLSLCQGIVAAHSGEINVESNPGQGTRFTLRLPLTGFSVPVAASSSAAEDH
jgi:signal transduction histidine kinase